MTNNPAYRQNWILDRLKANPMISYSVMFGDYSVMFGMSDKTFDKDWLKANLTFKTFQEVVNKEILKETIRLEKQAVKRNILSKLDALEELTKIAKGQARKIKAKVNNKDVEELLIPSFAEQRNAIVTLGTFRGWEATKKTDTNITISDFDITKIYDSQA